MWVTTEQPKTLDDLIGKQHNIMKSLFDKYDKGTLSHLIMITGGSGSGKTVSSRLLAAHILGLDSVDDLEADFNYTEVDCSEKNKSEDMREVTEALTRKPLRDAPRVIAFEELQQVHKGGKSVTSGQDVLLVPFQDDKLAKTNTYIIATTTSKETILPALNSRFFKAEFPEFTIADYTEAYERLKAKTETTNKRFENLTQSEIESLFIESNGNLREYIQLLDAISIGVKVPEDINDNKRDQESLYFFVRNASTYKEWIDKFSENGKLPTANLHGLLSYFTSVLVGMDIKKVASTTELTAYKEAIKLLSKGFTGKVNEKMEWKYILISLCDIFRE